MKFTSALNIALVLLTASILSCNNKETYSANDGGLILPAGFSSSIIADSLGKTRHLVVTPQNDIYVRLAQPKDGHGTLFLHEENGKAKLIYGFGSFGGTGIHINKNYLYTASDSDIFRYKLDGDNHVSANDGVPKHCKPILPTGESRRLVSDQRQRRSPDLYILA